MSWAKLDDAFPDHPKILGLSDAAFRLHVSGICYAARFETDGFIPRAALGRMGSAPEVAVELVGAGSWEATEGGWQIHDYLAYNPSKAQRAEQRQKGAERQERWRNGVSNAVTNPAPVPDPLPVPDPSEANASVAADAAEPAKQVAQIEQPEPVALAKRITPDFRAQMRIEFPELDEEAEYDRATNHIAYRKAIDKRRYYRNWLNNARKFAAEKGGPRANPRSHPQASPAPYRPDARNVVR